ncbi:MAG: hypothetical protein RTU92_08465 [Candidatus Thorarchaeota archaeon]
MRVSGLRAIDESGEPIDYRRQREYSNCRKQNAYCFLSIILFILAGVTSYPGVAESIPGGMVTIVIIDIGIVLTVLLLCRFQMK